MKNNSPPQPCNQVAYGLYNNRSGRSEVPTASINGRSRRMGYGRIMGSSNVASCRVKHSSLKPHEHQTNKMKQERQLSAGNIQTTYNFRNLQLQTSPLATFKFLCNVFPAGATTSVLAPATQKDILLQDIQ